MSAQSKTHVAASPSGPGRQAIARALHCCRTSRRRAACYSFLRAEMLLLFSAGRCRLLWLMNSCLSRQKKSQCPPSPGRRPRTLSQTIPPSPARHLRCRGEVAYDWRVIVAPDRVLDYLVIHELCHLKHFDHSRSFWSLVESQQPEYRDSRVWLTQHAAFVKSMFLAGFE